MSHMREISPTTLRGEHGPHFAVEETNGGSVITYRGVRFIVVKMNKKLPKGFHERTVAHIMGMLTGKRTELWDEQRVYGERAYDPAHGRFNASRRAETEEAAREGRPANLAQFKPPAE